MPLYQAHVAGPDFDLVLDNVSSYEQTVDGSLAVYDDGKKLFALFAPTRWNYIVLRLAMPELG